MPCSIVFRRCLGAAALFEHLSRTYSRAARIVANLFWLPQLHPRHLQLLQLFLQPYSISSMLGRDAHNHRRDTSQPALETPRQPAPPTSPSQIPLPVTPPTRAVVSAQVARAGLSTPSQPSRPGHNVYRQAPTLSANMSTVEDLKLEKKDNREKKGRKKVERVTINRPTPLDKPQPQPAEAPPPARPAWTGGHGAAWIQKAREESTARVVPAQSLPSSSQPQESSSSTTRSLQLRTRPRFIPDFKRLQPDDIKPFRFVNIEPLQGLPSPNLDQGWRGHPGVIVGTWDGEVGVVGTTSWGGKGADEKFDRAQDLLLYKKSFFPIFSAPEPMGDVAFDRLMLRTNGPVAFAHNTMIDGRSVRFIPIADFRNECSKYFRQGTREDVFLARGSAQNLEEQLWYLAGLDQVPWKASDHEGLKKWRYFKMREGFKPTREIPPEARIEAA